MAFVVMLVVWALTRSFVMSTAGSIEVCLLLPAIITRIRPGPPIDWAAEAHILCAAADASERPLGIGVQSDSSPSAGSDSPIPPVHEAGGQFKAANGEWIVFVR